MPDMIKPDVADPLEVSAAAEQHMVEPGDADVANLDIVGSEIVTAVATGKVNKATQDKLESSVEESQVESSVEDSPVAKTVDDVLIAEAAAGGAPDNSSPSVVQPGARMELVLRGPISLEAEMQALRERLLTQLAACS